MYDYKAILLLLQTCCVFIEQFRLCLWRIAGYNTELRDSFIVLPAHLSPMVSLLQEILQINRPLVFFVYGLVFFLLGFAILLQSRQHSRLILARSLHWLALFGITHGLHEWGDLFIPLQRTYLAAPMIALLQIGQVGLLAVSFTCLFQFALILLRPLPPKWRWLRWLPVTALILWALAALMALTNTTTALRQWLTLSNITARYFLGGPAALLAAYSLRYQTAKLIAPLHEPRILRMLKLASWSLAGYGLMAGVLVPPGSFFPANWLHGALAEQYLGIPVTILRSGFGFVLMIAIVRALEIFDLEMARTLSSLEEAQILTAERERIGRDLHDRTLQSIYAVGLLLKATRRQLELPENARIAQGIAQAEQTLDQAITEIRQHIAELRTQPATLNLDDGLRRLVHDSALQSIAEVELEIDLPTDQTLSPHQVRHLLAITGEALSNVARHAGARHVRVIAQAATGRLRLTITDDGVGIPADYVPGYGLRNMHERTRLLGGELHIESVPGRGTSLQLVAPWESANE